MLPNCRFHPIRFKLRSLRLIKVRACDINLRTPYLPLFHPKCLMANFSCTSCNGDKSWQCQDKKQCIRTEQRCDGWSDCNDGSDERGCVDTCCKKLSLGGIVFSKLDERMNGRPVYYRYFHFHAVGVKLGHLRSFERK